MKKNIFSFFVVMMFISLSLQAQVNYKITENTYEKISISFTFGALKTIDIPTVEGYFSQIYMDGCDGSNQPGNPELPVAVNMLEIPIFGDYVLNVYGKDYVIYDAQTLGVNYPVYPSQPSVSKSHTGPVEFIQNKNTYQTDAFYALPLARFEVVGIMRNVNLGELYVSPVQYNPVTNEIKVYKTIEVEILFKKTEIVRTQMIRDLHESPVFRPSAIINPPKSSKAEFSNRPVKYLIVAHAMFRGHLEEFMAWKRRKGFLTEIGYTDDENVGATTASIAGFIKLHYDHATPENPAPTFVLLVGDVQQIPAFTRAFEGYQHPTDLYYFTWAGGNIPCCYYGRFSAQNVAQLTPQIEKTLQYEQFTMPDPNYLNDIALIAGFDSDFAPTHANGFVNYATKYYANTEYGYTNVFAHLHPCTSQAAKIRTEIGAGTGIANYTAHCTDNGWSYPAFERGHIAAMNNANKYGLMIGSCCSSNKFDVNECFGEALLRSAEKGAVGYIGASNLTYWDEDYYWSIGPKRPIKADPVYDPARLGAYDRLFHTHEESYSNWMTTFGSMIVAGNEAVQSSTSTSSMKRYYWEIYHLMGDPSIMTYLTKPSPMEAILPSSLLVGETTLSAKVAPHAYCAITDHDGVLVSAGFANPAGMVTLHFNPLETGQYEFAAWAQNHIQYFKSICVDTQGICAVGGYITCRIYPNPARTAIMIETEKPIFSYEIVDMTGKRIVAEQGVNRSNLLVDVTSLAAGVYFVKVVIDNGKKPLVQKFVKQ